MNTPTHWLLLLLLALSTQAGAEVYKCRLADGQFEFTNAPCPKGSGTVKVRPDDKVSEADRLQAEREVERMRVQADKMEAAQRAERTAEAERLAVQKRNAPVTPTPPGEMKTADECLRDLENQVLEASQRATLEAACLANGRAGPPVYVPVPVPSGNPVSSCIESVLRLKLPPAEQGQRLAQCQGHLISPPTVSQPVQPKPVTPAPAESSWVICPPDNKNCRR